MEKNLTSKWLLISAILAMAILAVWPPSEKLNLGLDLAGGTSLLYEVDTKGAANSQDVIKQTIKVLQQRVDPNGVRNLIWRSEGANRVEIQMPLATEKVTTARKTYEKLMDSLSVNNVTRGEVIGAVKSEGAIQQQVIAALERGVQGRVPLLQAAAAAQKEADAARAEFEKIKADADKAIDAAAKAAASDKKLDQAIAAVLDTNLDSAEISTLLSLTTEPQYDKDRKPIPGSSPREKAIESALAQHAARAQTIKQLVEAHDGYQKVKGPFDDPNDLIRSLRGAGVLEFRIAVDPQEVPNLPTLRQQLAEKGPRAFGPDAPQKWYILDDLSTWADSPAQLAALKADPAAYLTSHNLIAAQYGKDIYILLWDTLEKALSARTPGWQISSAYATSDQRGFPAVSFNLNELGGSLMSSLTGNNIRRQMAIVLDNRVYSAPSIQSQIGSSGIITGGRGGFDQIQLDYLVRTLSAGSLKARLSENPISVRNVGPSLGKDNLQRGLKSVFVALIAVGGFMIVYYFFGGVIANIAVLVNILLILGTMSSLKGNFTLPGIAGIVLTIGMCVDANVLIFERIREELQRGVNMFTALRLGYQRALTAIVDSNLTTLIICIVLFYTCTADIAGFGLTLGIGIVATLIASLFMTQVFFITWYHNVARTHRMNFLPMAIPAIGKLLHPNVDWVSKRWFFYGGSGSLMVLGLLLVFSRGADMLDVEFRGGTEVSFELKQGQLLSLMDVRGRLDKTPLKDATVVAVGDSDGEFRAAAFSVMTGESDPRKVASIVRGAFVDVLDIQPVVSFKSSGAALKDAPVYAIHKSKLGAVINRPAVEDDITDYLGGAAIVLDDLSPTLTLDALKERLKSMRFQPDYENQQYRRFNVIGLAGDPAKPGQYASVAVVVAPEKGSSYFEDAVAWEGVLATNEWNLTRDALTREKSLSKISNFTPTVARTMVNDALVAIILSSLAIVVYVWFRFGSLRWGLGAILALLHDVMIALGGLAAASYLYDTTIGHFLLLEPFKINMTVVAAFLTIIGYSINDTIVVYDRIRENKGKLLRPTVKIMNDSVNQTLSRTFLTGGTTFISTLVLYILGGDATRGFAFCMMIGIITGTYSSWGIAAPLLLMGTPEGRGLSSAKEKPRSPQTANA